MMILGYKRDLQESDLWDINPRDKSDTVVPTFERLWKAEVERCMSKGWVGTAQPIATIHSGWRRARALTLEAELSTVKDYKYMYL